MTATSVNGLAVVTHQEVMSPIKTRTGDPVFWRQILELLLEDGTVVYGCRHCDVTDPRIGKVRAHLQRCSKRPSREEKAAGEAQVSAVAVEQVLAQLAELPGLRAELVRTRAERDKAVADRDEARARARSAERKLAAFRAALDRLQAPGRG